MLPQIIITHPNFLFAFTYYDTQNIGILVNLITHDITASVEL